MGLRAERFEKVDGSLITKVDAPLVTVLSGIYGDWLSSPRISGVLVFLSYVGRSAVGPADRF